MRFVWEKIKVTNGDPSVRILIIARNTRYVHEWCRIHEINPHSPMVRAATCFADLHGIAGMYYVDLGTDEHELRVFIERLKIIGAIEPLLTPNV